MSPTLDDFGPRSNAWCPVYQTAALLEETEQMTRRLAGERGVLQVKQRDGVVRERPLSPGMFKHTGADTDILAWRPLPPAAGMTERTTT